LGLAPRRGTFAELDTQCALRVTVSGSGYWFKFGKDSPHEI